MFKRLMRSTFMQAGLGGLVALWMTLVKYTTRWTIHHAERVKPIIESGEGFIGLTFHSRFLLLTSAWKRDYQTPHVLISRSRDGDIVAWTCRWLGLETIRGSARNAAKSQLKGGSQAGRDSVSALRDKGCVVITPDGPRGPRQRVPLGPLRLARLSGVPVVPCIFSVARRKKFDSWDRFILPLPFGRGEIRWGTVEYVAPDTSDEALEHIRRRIETDMNSLMTDADRALGHDPVEPA